MSEISRNDNLPAVGIIHVCIYETLKYIHDLFLLQRSDVQFCGRHRRCPLHHGSSERVDVLCWKLWLFQRYLLGL